MRVTGIAVVSPEAAKDNPKGTPELLASCFAKYSRSNVGIHEIFKKIDWADEQGSIDRIFKFIDYGHASIGGLTGGIAIAVDEASLLLIYRIFELGQLQDGQESSTRYIKYDGSALADPDDIGIPTDLQKEWKSLMLRGYNLYNHFYEELDRISREQPELLRIDATLPDKVKERIRKNYALDRARYFMPIATKNSGVFVMTARVWSQVIKELDSIPWVEAQTCAKLLRGELEKFAPRLIRHSYPTASSLYQGKAFHKRACEALLDKGVRSDNAQDLCRVRVWNDALDSLVRQQAKAYDEMFGGKENRYSTLGVDIKRVMVRASWNNVSVAELRDMNRHRTGHRFSPLIPQGFYLPEEVERTEEVEAFLVDYEHLVEKLAKANDNAGFLYGCLMGTQFEYEHSTHLDKFIYEIELRTGMGAHFRYAKHYRDAYEELMRQNPNLKDFVVLGEAEPE